MLLLLSVFSSVAWPCAGLFHEEAQLAESDAQSVIFEQTDAGVTVSYSVAYEGDAESFGWLIPLFGEFVSIEERDSADFAALYSWTQPDVEWITGISEEGSGGGCGRGLKSDNALGGADTAGGRSNDVVIEEGFTGSYAYQILDTTSSEAFFTWLEDNGWSSSGADGAIEAYVEEGGVQFAAITLTEAGGELLPPVSLTYTGDQMRFPATMGRQAMADQIRTIVYVHGESSAEVSGWASEPLGTLHGDGSVGPTSIYDDALLAIGGEKRGYGLVYSGAFEGADGWVTRFETLAEPGAHIADPAFRFTGNEDHVETIIQLDEAYTGEGWLLLPLALTGLGLGAARRRRRG